MRKTKSEGKTVGISANCSQCVANFAMRNFAMRKTTANFAMRKTIWQCENPFGNAKNHLAMRKTIWQCENPFGNAKNHLGISQCEKPFGNAKIHLAMRKTIWEFRNAKFRNAKTTLQISQCEKKISQCQMVANRLRKFMFFFFSSDFQYMLQNLHKTSKIKAIKIA